MLTHPNGTTWPQFSHRRPAAAPASPDCTLSAASARHDLSVRFQVPSGDPSARRRVDPGSTRSTSRRRHLSLAPAPADRPADQAAGRAAAGTGSQAARGTGRDLILIDVENQAACGTGLAEIVTRCRSLGGPDAVAVAAVSAQNKSWFESACAELDVRLLLSDDATSAADRTLLAVARTALAVNPQTRLIVASGDHAFATLRPDVVVSRNRNGISAKLADAAGEVVVLGKESAA